jgi:hypothetical protein
VCPKALSRSNAYLTFASYHVDDAKPSPGDNEFGLQVFRWLNTLVESHKAVRMSMKTARKCKAFTATLVRFLDHEGSSLIEPEHNATKDLLREAVRRSVISDIVLTDRANAWLEERFRTKLKSKFWGHVHAEAGLMAVACLRASSAPPELHKVCKLFAVSLLSLASSWIMCRC